MRDTVALVVGGVGGPAGDEHGGAQAGAEVGVGVDAVDLDLPAEGDEGLVEELAAQLHGDVGGAADTGVVADGEEALGDEVIAGHDDLPRGAGDGDDDAVKARHLAGAAHDVGVADARVGVGRGDEVGGVLEGLVDGGEAEGEVLEAAALAGHEGGGAGGRPSRSRGRGPR